jgi:hypothetical protein
MSMERSYVWANGVLMASPLQSLHKLQYFVLLSLWCIILHNREENPFYRQLFNMSPRRWRSMATSLEASTGIDGTTGISGRTTHTHLAVLTLYSFENTVQHKRSQTNMHAHSPPWTHARTSYPYEHLWRTEPTDLEIDKVTTSTSLLTGTSHLPLKE